MADKDYPIQDYFKEKKLSSWLEHICRDNARDNDEDVAAEIYNEVIRELSKKPEKNFSKDQVQELVVHLSKEVFRTEHYTTDHELRDWIEKSVHHQCSSVYEASDVLQETNVKLLTSRKKAVRKAYVSKIIWSCRCENGKRERRHNDARRAFYEKLCCDLSSNSVREISELSCDEVRAVCNLINALPEPHRVILDLRLFQHLSYKEIASKLKIRQNAARLRFFRAFETLVEILKLRRKGL